MKSNSRECRCCGYDIGSNPFCGICGMTPISITDSNMDLDAPAKDYIRKRFGGGKIELKCYTYSVEDNKLSENPAVSYEELCHTDDYWIGDIVKNDLGFDVLPTESEFSVVIRIKTKGESTEKTIAIKPEHKTDRSVIGVEFLPCLKARLVIGNHDNTAYSNEFDIM